MTLPILKAADFASDQDVRWCPGCGDYSILAQMKKVLPDLGVPREKTVFISGIGCSSRFPYYMNTYGMHSIHGRAPTFATGLKATRPDLMVWVITGDGDALSIGGNHFIHVLRRNVDLNIVLFNNRIYGLTKGQYSPTTSEGQVTKSTPMGSIDHPLSPLSVALAAEATFVARSIDAHVKHLGMVLKRAAEHKGTSLVEVYQNCNVFNDGAMAYAQERKQRAENVVELEHGKPLVFGKDSEKGIRLVGNHLQVVERSEVPDDDLLIHDEKDPNPSIQMMLARMRYPEMPEPIGVLRDVQNIATYDDQINDQVTQARQARGEGDLQALFTSGDTWVVD
ncbi:2-oxoacid:ferredoxin oxidoreductase subunit beta [Roseiconus lacunae]|uniref:2-oxoacid:ferredoxin oxidoreductase subunit beta n=1 Tax=Roseiconus lacunae TaxID=2605694 RepID=A0ABT7PCU8_9BACT|nr:2-oxoacid:ferredoxin oxidoreductase subunit beta [Roseiconus lacunae]MCD0459624.1 2-oxoacid:ferredoxin oxidoreductase subunit beta [Roseiconus lacunae]MDM4014323.1 2-oxoacid:ferredoxin oxidoreductase subunit beta [Roseiconus lacunae]WRQ49638.1 2-oxoacid:ferredoxin oxidoreductase subunit beta [Stieleria sp. HD01]